MPHMGLKQRVCRTLWGYESYKILVMNMGVVIIVLFVTVMAASGINEKCYIGPYELHYRQWMQSLEGKLTEEKEEKILKQKAYYDDVILQIEELQQKLEEGVISEEVYNEMNSELEGEQQLYYAFERVYERYEYVKEDSNRRFVYESGCGKLLGMKDRLYLGMFAVIILVLILLLSINFTVDKEKGMHNIIRSTPGGRKKAVISKVAISLICTGVIYVSFFMRNVYIAYNNYGLGSLMESASNLRGFAMLPNCISVLAFLIIFAILQMLALFIIATLIMFVSYRIGNTVHAIVWELVALLIAVVAMNQMYPFL